jgi:hypothetical protein
MKARQNEHARVNKGSMPMLIGAQQRSICMENRQNAA